MWGAAHGSQPLQHGLQCQVLGRMSITEAACTFPCWIPSAQSDGPCVSLHHALIRSQALHSLNTGCCDYAQHDKKILSQARWPSDLHLSCCVPSQHPKGEECDIETLIQGRSLCLSGSQRQLVNERGHKLANHVGNRVIKFFRD